MAAGFELAGQTFAPGRRGIVRIPVTVDLNGNDISVTVHVLVGAKPGATLLLMGVQHGDEWGEIELFRRVVSDTDLAALSGTLLVIPVCNSTALGQLSRNTQMSADGPDMNRIWPGTFNWISEQVAKTVNREILPKVSALLDFHFGMWGSNLGMTTYGNDYPDEEVNRKTRELAFAFGYPVLHRSRVVSGHPGPRSLMGFAGVTYKIPGVAAEVGGMGWGLEIEKKWYDVNVKGVVNVMKHLGMLAGKPELPEKFLDYSVHYRVDPTKGGILMPAVEPDDIGRAVKKGEVLARVISPYTFEELEKLVSPCDGVLACCARSYAVRPGDWCYMVADTTAADSKWVSAKV